MQRRYTYLERGPFFSFQNLNGVLIYPWAAIATGQDRSEGLTAADESRG